MNIATNEVAHKTRSLIVFQLGVGCIVAVFFFFFKDLIAGASAVYGALIATASAFMLGAGVKKADSKAISDPGKSMGVLYFGAVKRFLLVVILFVVGMKFLNLDALAVAAGFIAAQAGFVFLFKGLSRIG